MYDWLYRLRLTPWIVAGRLQSDLVTRVLRREESRHGTGRTLVDLGCGSGEHALSAARRGWVVTGVDASPTAIGRARQAARAANLSVQFIVGDIRRLPEIPGVPTDVTDFVDVGVYHGLSTPDRRLVAAGVEKLAGPRASLVVVGLDCSPGRLRIGVTAQGLASDFPTWSIEQAETFELGVRGPLRKARFRVFRLTRQV